MFSRLTYEEWQMLIPVIAFFIFFPVFIVILIKVFFMKREDCERRARLPLEGDATRS